MNEQFIIVKHGASFQVIHNEGELTIEALYPGRLYPLICQSVAASQCSIAQFYLAEQLWKGIPFSSLIAFFSKKGWHIQEKERQTV